jgi:hypothetical protein
MDEIKEIPGKIWQYLSDKGEISVYKVKKDLKIPDSYLYIGIGWLIKEDKLTIKRDGGSLKISLK